MLGQKLTHQMTNAFCPKRRLWGLQPETIGLVELGRWRELWELTGIDAVGIGHNVTLGCLAKDFSQPHDRNLL